MGAVLRALLNFCHRPVIRNGLARDPRGRFRDPRFVSFMAQGNRKTLDTDVQDAVLRGRKAARTLLKLAVLGGGAWIAIESAKALAVF